jgi:hypothetical protein
MSRTDWRIKAIANALEKDTKLLAGLLHALAANEYGAGQNQGSRALATLCHASLHQELVRACLRDSGLSSWHFAWWMRRAATAPRRRERLHVGMHAFDTPYERKLYWAVR